MPDSPEEPRLSGLARSIDSLFADPPATAPPKRSSAAPTEVTPAVPVEEPTGEAAPPEPAAPKSAPSDPRPLAPQMFPSTQMIESLDAPPPAPPPTVANTFATEPESSEPLLAFDEPAEPAAEPPVTKVVRAAESSPADDATRFTAAVNEYVAGDRSERDRIQTLAVGLRERLELDTLADAVEKLLAAAGDPPDKTYVELARGVMNPAVASRLVQRMGRERDEFTRAGYMTLCRRLGLIMANSLKGALTGALEPQVRRVYHEALLDMGEVSRPVIEAMVDDENKFLARDAVVMLGELGGPRAVQLVTSALANTDPRVRAEALHALGKLGDAEAGSLVLGFLEDADTNVRLAAAVAAGRLGLERALRPLLLWLEQNDDPEQRVRLLQALGDLGDPGAVPAIEKHAIRTRAKKGDTEVKIAAYRALHRIGTPHARQLVQQATSDKDPAVRAAARALAR